MKTCTKCGETKDLSEYPLTDKGKPSSRCQVCKNTYNREYYNNPDNREKKILSERKRRLKNRYGLTEEQYQRLVARSGGVCECCGAKPATHVDHDHTTLEIRGLICNSCNTGIGQLGDTVEGVSKALHYLKNRKPESSFR